MTRQQILMQIINENLDLCISYKEFNPAPSVLDKVIGALAKMEGAAEVFYDALNGDITVAAAEIAHIAEIKMQELGCVAAYNHAPFVTAQLRKRQLLHEYALHFLSELEWYAWELIEENNNNYH